MMSAAPAPASSAKRVSGYSDPAFARIADLAHVLAGLVFPPNRQPSAEAGMRRAMSVLHVNNPVELVRLFEVPGPPRDAVLAELTIGESYFFRESAQLDVLVTDIIPARKAEASARALRVWSAGCASGEEPYTVAIMLREQGWSGPSHILATDIARPRLAAAQRGRYTRWALRGVADERVARWFTRSGSSFDLPPNIREMVEFRAFNLVVDNYPGAEEGQFDLILCRNVMIYFDMETVARIATGLLASLAPDGWLVLGASDPPLSHLVPCESLMTPSGMVYRRLGASPGNRPARWDASYSTPSTPPSVAAEPRSPSVLEEWRPAWSASAEASATSASPADAGGDESVAPRAESRRDTEVVAASPPPDASQEALVDAYRRADYQAAESMVLRIMAREGEIGPATWITYIRSVANQGRLHEAGELNARALELFPLDAELHYLHATLLMEAGWFVDAAAAARRSIYLDRKLAMGHLLLGEAQSRIGEPASARNAFANALQLLDGADVTESVRAADGVTVSRLRQIAALRLRGVEGATP
jgi:chemotaxis protein methyltransferase CheR